MYAEDDLARLLKFETTVNFFRVHCCFTSTETTKTVRDGEPRTSTSTFTRVLSSELFGYIYIYICFTSTEASLFIRDGDRGEGDERVKAARPRIPPEKDRRDRGPPPEQWKC